MYLLSKRYVRAVTEISFRLLNAPPNHKHTQVDTCTHTLCIPPWRSEIPTAVASIKLNIY